MKTTWLIILSISTLLSFGQSEQITDPISSAFGYGSFATHSPFAVFGNATGAKDLQASLGVYIQNQFALKDFSSVAISGNYAKFSFGFRKAGNKYLQEYNPSLAINQRLYENVFFSFGLNNFINTNALHRKARFNLCTNFGLLTKLTRNISLFSTLQNLYQTETNPLFQKAILNSLGLIYHVDEKLSFQMEYQGTDLGYHHLIFALSLSPVKNCILRYGLRTNPWSNHLGMEFTVSGIKIYLSASYHYRLGYSPSTGFAWIKQRKEA